MGSQLMNSLLYMANYLNETHNSSSVNYDTTSFPTGHALVKRPFIYVNLFWTIMPIYAIMRLLCAKNWISKKKKTPTPAFNDNFQSIDLQNIEVVGYNYL